MDGSYPGKLRLWQSWTSTLAEDESASARGHPLAGPHYPRDFADRLYASEALHPPTAVPRMDEGAEPYSLQWFLTIENHRHKRQGRWIPRVLEFAKHTGETLLGLGNGLGTDWLQYARHGAQVVVCSESSEQLALVRRNFELRGLGGRFLHATPENLPLGNASIDVACVCGLLDELTEPARFISEVFRVLKPGGKILAVTTARYNVNYWRRIALPWERWLRNRNKSDSVDGTRFSGRELCRLFEHFTEHRIYKRHLRRRQVPHLWRWLPLPLLERLMGHVLVLKAFKPLSAATTLQAAA